LGFLNAESFLDLRQHINTNVVNLSIRELA